MHAEEIAPDRPMFVRVNRTNFLQPVRIGDKLDFTSHTFADANAHSGPGKSTGNSRWF